MKTLLLFIVSFCTCTAIAWAQNSVIVKQEGNGNSVSINQSSQKGSSEDCKENTSAARNNKANQILIYGEGADADTMLNQSAIHKNIVNNHPDFPLLSATQKGRTNLLLMQLTDIFGMINTDQPGENNFISARLDSSSHQLSLTQKGSNNTININPCSNNEK